MLIICSYFKATEVLKPYLFKYLENNAYDVKRPYYCNLYFNLILAQSVYNKTKIYKTALAQICLTSLRKTYRYGGRRNVPSQIELDAIIVMKKKTL